MTYALVFVGAWIESQWGVWIGRSGDEWELGLARENLQ